MRQAIGLVIIATGFLLVMISLLQNSSRDSASYGGLMLIGPIPIIFGSSPKMAFVSMIMAAGLMVLVFLLFRRH
jgi:uncharacterized protein (TIGR00304 family)